MMEHKAFLFRFQPFQSELRPVLERSLQTGDVEPIVAFIEAHRESLSDPNAGLPLGEDWHELLETKDVHQYGDLALTKYYDPTTDEGLGTSWTETQEALGGSLGDGAVLGEPLCSGGICFDPGKMGSYFQSELAVKENLHALQDQPPHPVSAALVALLEKASLHERGLYVTF